MRVPLSEVSRPPQQRSEPRIARKTARRGRSHRPCVAVGGFVVTLTPYVPFANRYGRHRGRQLLRGPGGVRVLARAAACREQGSAGPQPGKCRVRKGGRRSAPAAVTHALGGAPKRSPSRAATKVHGVSAPTAPPAARLLIHPEDLAVHAFVLCRGFGRVGLPERCRLGRIQWGRLRASRASGRRADRFVHCPRTASPAFRAAVSRRRWASGGS